MSDLIPVLLPRKEAQQRLTIARQTAKTYRRMAGGAAQFGPKDARNAAKVTRFAAFAEEAEAIAASCLAGLKSVEEPAAIPVENQLHSEPEGLPADESVTEYAGVDEDGG